MLRAAAIAVPLAFACLLAETRGAEQPPPLAFVRSIGNPDGDISIDFGRNVAASIGGATIAISSTLDSEAGVESGAVWLFDDSGSLVRKISQPDRIVAAGMGLSMDWTDDGRLVVGGWSPGVEAPVYVFDQKGNLLHRIKSPFPSGQGQFGISVDAIGNDILIGSVFDDDLEEDAGAVYLFDEDYQQVRRYVSPDQTPSGLFGRFLDVLDDETFVVGAYGESHEAIQTGRAYVFNVDGSLIGTLKNPNPLERDAFGINVAKAGDDVLVGSIQHGGAESGGLTYLFTREGDLLATFENPRPDERDWFGYYTAGAGDYVVVGANLYDTLAYRSGAAYVFDRAGTLWQEILDPTPGDSGSFGNTFRFGDRIFISSPYDGAAEGQDGPGAVFVYQLGLLPGDVDMNGVVDLGDFATLKANFGDHVDARVLGDLTGDLFVDLSDFNQLKENFGATAAVPEASGLGMLAFSAAWLASWLGVRFAAGLRRVVKGRLG